MKEQSVNITYLSSSQSHQSFIRGRAPGAPLPGSAPVLYSAKKTRYTYPIMLFSLQNLMMCTSVSEWLLLDTSSAIFQLYNGENELISNEMMMRPALFLTNTLSWIFLALAHWINSPRIDMSLYSGTLFWFRANQYLLFLLSAVWLAEKPHI